MMSKSIELTNSQIKSFENGATMFLVAIPQDKQELCRCAKDKEEFIRNYSPLQKGDKDVWIKEEFKILDCDLECECQTHILYYDEDFSKWEDDVKSMDWERASEMIKEESRYSFKEILDVRVVRVQDIKEEDIFKLLPNYDYDWSDKLGVNWDNNDYIFLVEVKGK